MLNGARGEWVFLRRLPLSPRYTLVYFVVIGQSIIYGRFSSTTMNEFIFFQEPPYTFGVIHMRCVTTRAQVFC